MNQTHALPSVRNWRDWVGLVARLVPGIIFLYAGITKITDIPQFASDIWAYELLPYMWMADVLAYILPVVEILAALLLIIGLLTRGAALVTLLMLVVFMIGIGWVWSQGISIDCGCFGAGGEVAPEDTNYPWKIAENLGMSALCVWLLARPRSLFSIDSKLLGPTLPDYDDLSDDAFPDDVFPDDVTSASSTTDDLTPDN